MKKDYTVLILFFIPILFWLIIYWGYGFDGLYGQDSYEYLRYANAIRNFILTGENPGDYFWPLYYPIFGAIVSLVIKNTVISLQLISVLSLSVSSIYLYKLMLLVFPFKKKITALYTILFFIFSPFVIRSSMIIMSDILATCFIILTVYNFYKFKINTTIFNFYNIAVFSALALMTRYACAVVLIPIVMASSFYFFKTRGLIKHIPFLILISCFLLFPHFVVRYSNYGSFLSHQWLQNWSLAHFFQSSFTTIDGSSYNLFPNLIYGFSNFFHPGYLLFGLPFIFLIFLKPIAKYSTSILLFSVVLYAFFLAGIPFQNNRFLLLSFPLVILVLFPAFDYLNEIFSRKLIYIGSILILSIQLVLTARAFKPTLERNNFEVEMVKLMKPYQDKTLYSFDVDVALKGRGLDFEYHNLWGKKYTNYKQGDLVLFHPTKFEEQWKGKNPMLNWNFLSSHFKLKPLLNCPDGWQLYQIQTH